MILIDFKVATYTQSALLALVSLRNRALEEKGGAYAVPNIIVLTLGHTCSLV